MFILSAFADEISPDPVEQVAVLKACQIRFIEFRSIYGTNVLKLSDAQIHDFKALLKGEGFGLSAIGSPIGKVPIDQPFAPHLDLFQRAIDLCQVFDCPRIRVFSYYPPANNPTWNGDWSAYRNEVMQRMQTKAELAAKAGVTLFHENEHNIYGDKPERVQDMLQTVNTPALCCAYDAANWVFCGYDPKLGWDLTKDYTTHLHIKDWKTRKDDTSHGTGVLPGHGDGQMLYSLQDAVSRGYHGFAVMEPHLRGGGPTGGVTGPDLFPVAVQAFRDLLRQAGGQEQSTL